jgi:hypothetical protein
MALHQVSNKVRPEVDRTEEGTKTNAEHTEAVVAVVAMTQDPGKTNVEGTRAAGIVKVEEEATATSKVAAGTEATRVVGMVVVLGKPLREQRSNCF